ncbi:helix-turn-helix domain-containing protein [Halostella litorea]|uniref:helix-turn-helix domain-containing protein n=1 Tax=Halostella litorea TaxID=2528831 RepID=UPI001092EF3A|nr:helix-turn-helix domain-containing protein [Halostella litorea]
MSGENALDAGSSSRRLHVEFDVRPPAPGACPLGDLDGEFVDVRQQLVDDECHADVTVWVDDRPDADGARVVHTTSAVDGACPCTVFSDLGCVPRVLDVAENRVTIGTYLPDRDQLTDLVDRLDDVFDGFSLRRLRRVDPDETDGPAERVTLDLRELTEKQREAAAAAVASGYYSPSRESSFGELAAELDISKSALSQRLSAVESTLATAAFAEAADTG